MKYGWIAFCVLLLAACGSSSRQKPAEQARRFELPQPPMTLQGQEARAAYMVEHYWDKFDFTDTLWLQRPEVVEQALVDYLQVLNYVPAERAQRSLTKLVNASVADTAMFDRFERLLDKYLYDPNSPMRNEEYYIPVLEAIIASPAVDEWLKVRPRHRLEMALKNRPGSPAQDFTYTLASGRQGRLYDLKSDYTLLFFYNPGCTNCREVREQITASPVVGQLRREGAIDVLALYPDQDLTEWRNYRDSIPRDWINAYDQGTLIESGRLYDLKAIPTLYLLDASKRVLLKDTPFGRIEALLAERTGR